MTDLPEGWTQTTLGEVCKGSGFVQTGPFGSQLHAHDYTTHGVALIMPKDMYARRACFKSTSYISQEKANLLEKHLTQPGDLVWSRRGNVTDRVLISKFDPQSFCGTGCLLVRVSPKACLPAYLYYATGSRSSMVWLEDHAVGATMPNLNTSILGALPLVLPPLREQEAIAGVLGALDDKIEANLHQSQSLINLCSSNFAHYVATVSISAKFSDHASISGGGTPKTSVPEYWGGSNLWATPTDVTSLDAPYLVNTNRKITEAGLSACSSRLHAPRCIFMTSRATIGAMTVNLEPSATNQGFIVLRPHRENMLWWLFHCMSSMKPSFIAEANGATFLELPRKKFAAMSFPLPPNCVLEAFHARSEACHQLAASLQQENRILAELRDTLLGPLVSGRLRVKDAAQLVGEVA